MFGVDDFSLLVVVYSVFTIFYKFYCCIVYGFVPFSINLGVGIIVNFIFFIVGDVLLLSWDFCVLSFILILSEALGMFCIMALIGFSGFWI